MYAYIYIYTYIYIQLGHSLKVIPGWGYTYLRAFGASG